MTRDYSIIVGLSLGVISAPLLVMAIDPVSSRLHRVECGTCGRRTSLHWARRSGWSYGDSGAGDCWRCNGLCRNMAAFPNCNAAANKRGSLW